MSNANLTNFNSELFESAEGQGKRIRKICGEIVSIMIKIRASTPQFPVDQNMAKGSEIWEANFNGKPSCRVIIYLRSSGCNWVIKVGSTKGVKFKAGCLDCEHSIAETTFGQRISSNSYLKQFIQEYEKYDFSKFPILCLYNEGNFFNEKELPTKARDQILEIIGKNESVQSLIIESLPEYINTSVLDHLIHFLPKKKIEIGIGLESSNDIIRKVCVNKSFNLDEFGRAVHLIKQFNAKVLAYVMLKPSFLCEREAINDAIETIKYAFNLGVDIVSLEPVNISDFNMAGTLTRLGLHRVPWLWSVVEVAKRTMKMGEIRLGGYQFSPFYHWTAHNCPKCTQRVKEAIKAFNSSYDGSCFEGLHCDCKLQWEEELEERTPPILDRVESIIPGLKKAVRLIKLKNELI